MKGVDSCKNESTNIELLKKWAEKLQTIIAVTGKEDWITDGKQFCVIKNGDSKMQQITGTGCMCASICGAYATFGGDAFWGAVTGVMMMSLSGELAVRKNEAPIGSGTLRVQIMDELNLMNVANLKQESKVCYEA